MRITRGWLVEEFRRLPESGPKQDLCKLLMENSGEFFQVVPAATAAVAAESKPALPDSLEWNRDVSATSPVVKGTWITVNQIVSLIVDGWRWAEILRAHSELVEDDIRAALAYTIAEEAKVA